MAKVQQFSKPASVLPRNFEKDFILIIKLLLLSYLRVESYTYSIFLCLLFGSIWKLSHGCVEFMGKCRVWGVWLVVHSWENV